MRKAILELDDDELIILEEGLELWVREHTMSSEKRAKAFDIKKEIRQMIKAKEIGMNFMPPKMNYNKFVKKVKNAKLGKYAQLYDVKVTTNRQHNLMEVHREHPCSYCKHTYTEKVIVKFKEPHRLTIFEAGLLFSLFVLNKKPADYAQFHKSQAGKNFIDNIEEVRTE